MTAFIVRRLLILPLLVLCVITIVFFIVRSAPGDPLNAIVGEKASREDRDKARRAYGLDKSLVVQYGIYLSNVTQLDFGESWSRRRPVLRDLSERLPATIELSLAALAIAIVVGVALGIVTALKRGTWIDYLGMGVALVGVSVPVFWLGLLLILACAGFLPAGGYLSPDTTLVPRTHFVLLDAILSGNWDALSDAVRHLALPALALSTIPMAMIARMTRSSMLEILHSDYIRTARAKGLPQDVVVLQHALRNALIPIVTLTGLELGILLGGAVLTETVFDWPGMGTYIVESVLQRDQNAVLGGVIAVSSAFILINLLVDLSYAVINPRIRHESTRA